MATQEDLTLTGNDKLTVSLGASTAFIIQNKSSESLYWRVLGSTSEGAVINKNDMFSFNYDIEIWYQRPSIDGVFNTPTIKVPLIRE